MIKQDLIIHSRAPSSKRTTKATASKTATSKRKENYSRIEVKNRLKNKYTVGILANNYGDSKQNGIWRRGINLNIDSPLGIGDNFYFTYMTVLKKNPNRDWKKSVEQLEPGEILPIGPTGYNPANGDTLPYKRRLDMFNFGYTMKFRT